MKILFVEHDFSSKNCTTKGLYFAVSDLKKMGHEITVMSDTYEEHPDVFKHISCGALKRPWFLRYLSFILHANWKQLRGNIIDGYDIVHTSNGLFLFANISTFHFSEWDWVKTQCQYLKPKTGRALYEFFSSIVASAVDFIQLKRKNIKLVAVSDSIAELLQKKTNSLYEVGVLPNAVDGSKFGVLSSLDASRAEIRTQFGFIDTDQVFCFCANGTHRRKGFWLMLDALKLLNSELPFKLMVIGGSNGTLEHIRSEIQKNYPNIEEKVVYTGQLDDGVADYMNACEALLFPSYFEAFSLVEIEASRMGLPLYLTRHNGSEMILEDNKNGRYLPFDAKGISVILTEELELGIQRVSPPVYGRALEMGEYGKALDTLYKNIATQQKL